MADATCGRVVPYTVVQLVVLVVHNGQRTVAARGSATSPQPGSDTRTAHAPPYAPRASPTRSIAHRARHSRARGAAGKTHAGLQGCPVDSDHLDEGIHQICRPSL